MVQPDSHQLKKMKTLFIVFSITVQIALVLKCPLYILRQLSPTVFLYNACPEKNISESITTDRHFQFTMVIYSCQYMGRWAEALVIHIYIYKFFLGGSADDDEFNKRRLDFPNFKKERKNFIIFLGLTVYMLIHSLAVPAIGMVVEAKHVQAADCNSYIYEHHFVYWILDVIRNLNDVLIHLLLALTTMTTGRKWSIASKKKDGSNNNCLENKNKNNIEMTRFNSSDNEVTKLATYLKDKTETSENHFHFTELYTKKGEEVKPILEVFQAWFIIPWVLFIIQSSLQSDEIVKYYRDDMPTTTDLGGEYDMAEVGFILHNFLRIFFLSVSFFCSKIMNAQHQKYLSDLRNRQVYDNQPLWNNQKEMASKQAMASMNIIEKDDYFNFTPRILGSSIRVKMDENPFFVAVLFITTFFTIVNGLT